MIRVRTGNYCQRTVLFNMGRNLQKRDIVYSAGISAAVENVDDVKTFTLRTTELIDCLYKRGYNRYFLQREIQRVNNITLTEALTLAMTLPHWTKQDVFPSLSPTTPPFVLSHRSFTNTFTSLFHSPVAITSLKLHLL